MNTILTIDYEVFGNGSGEVRPCMMRGARILARIAEDFGGPVVLFVEPLELMARARSGPVGRQGVAAVRSQVRELHRAGHEIGLHLHPQWLPSAIGARDPRRFDPALWRFGDLSDERRREAVSIGLQWLRETLDADGGRASIVSFRAGGWCIQPIADAARTLWQEGIRLDSSVAPGLRVRRTEAWYDFSTFEAAAGRVLYEDVAGGADPLLEVPVATGHVGRGRRLLSEAVRRMRPGPGRFAEGCTGTYRGESGSVRGLAERVLNAGRAMADFASLSCRELCLLADDWARRTRDAAPSAFVMVGHTKNFTSASERHLRAFLDRSITDRGWSLTDLRSIRARLIRGTA